MNVKLDRFRLVWMKQDNAQALVHIDCGELIHFGLLVDDWTLQFWVDYARKHRCSENTGL